MIQKNSQEENAQKNLEIISLDPSKRCFGLIIDTKMFLASLVDLPCLIEAQKTLDFRTFYKSVDVAQMLYVHNKSIDDIYQKQPEELIELAKKYNPILEDPDFLQSLYKRGETSRKVEEMTKNQEEVKLDNLKFRHGLAPVGKNIRNIRYKKEPNVDPDDVHAVETILKDIIDYGFADNVEEELLEFDDQGNLVNCIKGAKEKRKEPSNSLIQLDKMMGFGEHSVKSGSLYQQSQNPFGNQDQSDAYSQSMQDPYDDGGTSLHQDTVYNEPGNEFSEYGGQQQTNYPIVQFPSADQYNQQQQQQYNMSYDQQQQQHQFIQQPYNEQQQNHPMQVSYQNQQPDSSFAVVSQSQFLEPRYTQDDLRRMKQDYKELKTILKSTKNEITIMQQQGVDVTQIQEYYKGVLAKKSALRQQKKAAIKQLKGHQ